MFLMLLACSPDAPPVHAPGPDAFEHWLHAVPDEVLDHDGRLVYDDLVALPPDTLAATVFARTHAERPGCLDALGLGATSHTFTSLSTVTTPTTARRLLRHTLEPLQLRESLSLYVEVDTWCDPGLEVRQLDVFIARGAVR